MRPRRPTRDHVDHRLNDNARRSAGVDIRSLMLEPTELIQRTDSPDGYVMRWARSPASARRIEPLRPDGDVTWSRQPHHVHERAVPNWPARTASAFVVAVLRYTAATAAVRRCQAMMRLRCCERSSVAVTSIPVGVWRKRTAESVLLRCWPPAPDARNVSTRTSR
jgi:hypothetical protein